MKIVNTLLNFISETPKPDSQAAHLVEYQACQDDINSNSQSYWTLASIFVGVSSASYAAILLVLAQTDSVVLFVNEQKVSTLSAWMLFAALVIGICMIVILHNVHKWLRRINFLSDILTHRMREIEASYGMMKSSLIDGMDKWHNRRLSPTEKVHLLQITKRDAEWFQNPELKLRTSYRPGSRNTTFLWIFRTLVFLWTILLIGVMCAIGNYFASPEEVFLLLVVLSLVSYCYVCPTIIPSSEPPTSKPKK